MRFCPFCSAENADELAVCQACGRRLPPLPPRRARNAPPTGIQLPPRPGAAPPPPVRKPMAASPTPPAPQAAPGDGATVVSAPPIMIEEEPAPHAELLNALSPAPAAERRAAPPPEDRQAGDPARRRSDGKGLSPTAFARPLTSDAGRRDPQAPRSTSPSQPPPLVPATTRAQPPAGPGSPLPGGPPPTPLPPPPVAPPHAPAGPAQPPHVTSPAQPPPVALRSPVPGAPSFAPSGAHARPGSAFVPESDTSPMAAPPLEVAAGPRDWAEPPPTRIHRAEAPDRPFTPPKVFPVPEIPEPGLVNAARYAYEFARARWQRRGAIKQLGLEIKQDTEALDQVLGALGRTARGARVEGRVFSAENAAISSAEERISQLQHEMAEVEARKLEENSKFVDVERERNEKLVEAERTVEEGQRELSNLEAQRRALRDKRKDLERRQKAYLRSAEDHDRQAGSVTMGDQRQELRRAAEGHRREAAALEPERQEIDRRLAALERPINEAAAKLDAGKAELDAAKRSLNDAREGHTHRLAELDAEQKRKAREIGLAEAEIQRRLVTLGTLVNLNRIEDPQFGELYLRIDRLRGAITARTTEIEKLTAEREAFDRGTLVRGIATIGGAFVVLIALIVILRAIL